jgi:thiamine biosynthesis lipoprotein
VIKIIGISAAAAVAWKAGLRGNGAAVTKVSESRMLMGTVVNLTVIGADEKAASAAVSATLDRMAQLEASLSRYRPSSELSRLNQDGFLHNAGQPLLDLVAQSRQLSDLTQGAFDISVKPLLDLYQEYQTRGELPPETAVAAAKDRVNYKNIHVTGHTIRFRKPGMGITLDGIGKGYIVDAGTAVLHEHQFSNVLVEAGGDLMASGKKGLRELWQIGIQPPRQQEGAQVAVLGLRNQAAATSGDYMQPFEADFSRHHIIDPRTGYSAPELASVTITAPTVMLGGWAGDGRGCARQRSGAAANQPAAPCRSLSCDEGVAADKNSRFCTGLGECHEHRRNSSKWAIRRSFRNELRPDWLRPGREAGRAFVKRLLPTGRFGRRHLDQCCMNILPRSRRPGYGHPSNRR